MFSTREQKFKLLNGNYYASYFCLRRRELDAAVSNWIMRTDLENENEKGQVLPAAMQRQPIECGLL
jgi:hypothetical protein